MKLIYKVFRYAAAILIAGLIIAAVVTFLHVWRLLDAIYNPPLNRSLFWLKDTHISRLPEVLANGADPNEQNHQGMSAMHWAAWYADGESLRLLIEAGGNVHQRDNLGRTPLFFAANNMESNSALTMLLDHGADVNARNQFGQTPLFEAVKLGATEPTSGENVLLLIAAGADVNAVSKDGRTVLHYAASSYYPHWGLAPIIDAGADLDAQDDRGGTALYSNGLYAPLENQTLLLEAGANPHLENDDGYSACTDPYGYSKEASDLLKQLCLTGNSGSDATPIDPN